MEDKEIVGKILNVNTLNEGFGLLVKKYQQKVYWHVRKMVIDHDDADDLTQEVFVKVWKGIQHFREESSLFTWIYKIATNECLNFLRKKKSKFFIPVYDIEAELAQKLSDNELISGDEIQMKLQKALLKLPDKQRLVFNMKYFDDMKYEDIAEVTNTSVGSLKASYHHAVKKIEEFIKDN